MENIDTNNFSQKIHSFLDDATKKLSPDLIEFLRRRFQTSIIDWMIDEDVGLQVKLVIDSNTVIRSLKYSAKTGKDSLLSKLQSNPLFPIYSPQNLETEVLNYIENKEKNKEYKLKMKKTWELMKQHIIFQEEIDLESWNKANEIVGKRDQDDVPFVGVYFDLNADGVITEDKHYEHPEITRFNIESLGEIVGTYHRGIFSFFILNDFSPLLFDLIIQLSLSILKLLSEIFFLFLNLIKSIASGTISKILDLLSKAPSWCLPVLAIILITAGIAIALHDDARNKIKHFAQNIKEKVKPYVDKLIYLINTIFGKLIKYAEKSIPYAGMALVAIKELNENIKILKKEIHVMISEESLSSS